MTMTTPLPDLTARTFWVNTGERVVRTAAQTALAVGITDATTALHADWAQTGITVGLAAGTCLLMCLAGKLTGDPGSPSFVLPAPSGDRHGRHEAGAAPVPIRLLGGPLPPYDRDARQDR